MQAEGDSLTNNIYNAQLANLEASPSSNLSKFHCRDFESPIEIASKSLQYLSLRSSVSRENENGSMSSNRSNGTNRNSPEEQFQGKYSQKFKNIIQRENEDSDNDCQECQFQGNDCYDIMVNSPENLDMLGNLLPICEFKVQDRSEEQLFEQPQSFTLPEINQDKQNDIPPHFTSSISMQVYTPLKNKENFLRSPLRDITPKISKKMKISVQTIQRSDKSYLLTPRALNLTESRRNGSGMRRMERL